MPSQGGSKKKVKKVGAKSKKSRKVRRIKPKSFEALDGSISTKPNEFATHAIDFHVPDIDFGNLKEKEVQDTLFRGLTDVGFLILSNHGIEDELIQKVYKVSTDFYSGTHEERMRMTDREGSLLISEGSAFTDEPYTTSPNDPTIKLDPEAIDEVFDEYLEKLSNIGIELLSWCEKVLGLVKGRLVDNYEPAGTIMDALFYDKTPEGEWGTKQHYDNCMMTMLMQDDVGGLELRHKGKWYPVVPQYGKFIINFGKMMEHFTYGVIKATLHRVRNTKNRMRISWPLFLGPNLNRGLLQLIEFKWNEHHYLEVEKERVEEENKENEENAAHIHLNVSEKGHHVWEMIPRKHLKKYRALLKVQNNTILDV